jgi:hypothetical protein
MWIPASTAELESAVLAGEVDETSQLDFKQALPVRRNDEIAVDVSAMTVDGGVLIYGVGEDEDRRPTVLHPIDLAGAAERIDQVLRTSVHEAPTVRCRPITASDGSGRGYLVVTVPSSPRAPHQVVAKGRYQHRYYGRGPTGNRVLTEAEIARLYARREEWSFDAAQHLGKVVGLAPFERAGDLGYLHAFVRPVVVDDDRWTSAARGDPTGLHRKMLDAARLANSGLGYDPALADQPSWVREGADAWSLGRHRDEAWAAVRCEVNFDGRGQLFCGRAAAPGQSAEFVLFEVIVAGNLASFFALMAELFDAAGYVGPVDVGIALTGIRGAQALTAVQNLMGSARGYPACTYQTTTRVPADALRAPRDLTRQILGRFFEALAGPEYDPFG